MQSSRWCTILQTLSYFVFSLLGNFAEVCHFKMKMDKSATNVKITHNQRIKHVKSSQMRLGDAGTLCLFARICMHQIESETGDSVPIQYWPSGLGEGRFQVACRLLTAAAAAADVVSGYSADWASVHNSVVVCICILVLSWAALNSRLLCTEVAGALRKRRLTPATCV